MEVRVQPPSTLVIVGQGPTGHRLVEALLERDTTGRFRITVTDAEAGTASGRVVLTSYLTDDADVTIRAMTARYIKITGGRRIDLFGPWADQLLPRSPDLVAMERHVASYSDQWRDVLRDPGRLRRLVSFVNSPGTPDPSIAFQPERDQIKPALVAGSSAGGGDR
jgi:NAD(P)H-nitrite reductase large subunit